MDKDQPPPLPPKLSTRGVYTEEVIQRALQDERRVLESMKRTSQAYAENATRLDHSRYQHPPATERKIATVSGPQNSRPRPLQVPPIPKQRTVSLPASATSTAIMDSEDENDLMSFASPEKPKNNLLEFLQTINANQSVMVPSSALPSINRPMPLHNLIYNKLSSSSQASSVICSPVCPSPMNISQMFFPNCGPRLPSGIQWAPQQSSISSSSMVQFPASSYLTPQPTATHGSICHSVSLPEVAKHGELMPPPLPARNLMSIGSCLSVLPAMPLGVSPVSLDLSPMSAGVSPISLGVSPMSLGASAMSVNAKLSAVSSGRMRSTSAIVKGDLIDLSIWDSDTYDDKTDVDSSSSMSILDDFDPLVIKSKEELAHKTGQIGLQGRLMDRKTFIPESRVSLSPEAQKMLQIKTANLAIETSCPNSEGEQSYYGLDDPFEYMQLAAGTNRSDPLMDIYEGLTSPGVVSGSTFDIPPPLPPRNSPIEDFELRRGELSPRLKLKHLQKKRSGVINGRIGTGIIQIRKIPCLSADDEARAFWNKICQIRLKYLFDDYISNPGLLHSPCVDGSCDPSLSVKLQIHFKEVPPVMFTSNLTTSIEHVIAHTLCVLELPGDCCDYILKVRGIDEYLSGETTLGEYEYVHSCVKYDQDVTFTLVEMNSVNQTYLRTIDDDKLLLEKQVESLMPIGSVDIIHFDKLSIVIDKFEEELARLQNAGFLLVEGTPLDELPHRMISKMLRQVVKSMCAFLGEIESLEITEAINGLITSCQCVQQSQGILDKEDNTMGQYGMSTGSQYHTEPDVLKQMLLDSLSRLSAAVNNFLIMYTRAFRVDFTVDETVDQTFDARQTSSVREALTVRISSLHRPSSEWQYDEYFVEAQLYHGSRCIGQPVHSRARKISNDDHKFYPKANFDQWLDLGTRINTLPKESRLVFTVFGVHLLQQDKSSDGPQYTREELGWAATQFFSFQGHLCQGSQLLTLWPISSDKRLGPAPHSADHPRVHLCPVLCIELPEYGGDILFPEIPVVPMKKANFHDLDVNTQTQLNDIIDQDIFTVFHTIALEDREILWEKRHYLQGKPSALAKVLLAAHSWDPVYVPDLHSMVAHWAAPSPTDAMLLLLPSFPDMFVRAKAIEWIRGFGSDELVTFLPQLVQAVKHETWDCSATVELLLERAVTSPRLAHHLYWLLNQCLPQQTNMEGEDEMGSDARYCRRLHLVTRALMVICGKNIEDKLLRQEAILRGLYATAMRIKDAKDSQRLAVLSQDLQFINASLESHPTSLPLSPSLEVAGVDIPNCSYYTSFTVPLRLAFLSSEPNTNSIHAIFKVGDDLRQDMLVVQMIRLMDKLWLREGLDLKMVSFSVVPTGNKVGIIELVQDAETLRRIQTEYGVTGSFKDRPIAEWLAKQNTSPLEYQRAVDNFTSSCAGYCVATYILGICDRHNDNIMLKTSGHLFHIDFGKFLGDAQCFGTFRRDRTPFVLTSDMAFVINGGDKPSDAFQNFVDVCCQAFNIIRKNGHLLLYLFALMASSGMPGVTWEAVNYVKHSLLQDKTNAEAGATFARMIEDSLKNWFTQVNFFIHNLAQMRFSGDQSDSILSFIPKTFTLAQDGRIVCVRLYSYQKRYNPNKYYVYILEVERENHREPSYLFRSYKEFLEFHQKLCLMFPLARIHSLPRGGAIGRSEVKVMAEKRKWEIELFLATLFDLSDEITHSEVIYTFFHPMLRDQEDTSIHLKKLKHRDARMSQYSAVAASGNNYVQGQVKVSVQYLRGQLQIMVQHARNLAFIGLQEPSPYVKLYLLPDPYKRTKRKTRVLRKTCHPTFMEPIIYRMSLDIVRQRTLEVSIWSEDIFSENTYLGSCYLRLALLKLEEEQCEWFSLEQNISAARSHNYPEAREEG